MQSYLLLLPYRRVLTLAMILGSALMSYLQAQTINQDSLLTLCNRLEQMIYSGYGTDYVPDIEQLKVLEAETDPTLFADSVLLHVDRTLALYYQNIDTDFPSALNYGFKALELARKLKSPVEEASTLSLISSIYFLKDDTTGLNYAREAYIISQREHINKSLYTSECNIANYLFNLERYEEAMHYLQEAFQFVQDNEQSSELQYLYAFLGDIHYHLGNREQAEKYYELSVVDLPTTTNYDKLYARICYSIYLSKTQRYDQALALLLEVEHKAQEWNISTFKREILENKSNVYELTHRYHEALTDYKLFVAEKERMVNDEKEKAVRVLELKYEVAREHEKNALQQVELLEKDRRMILFSGLSLLLLISAVFLWILNQRQKRRYEEIVRQQLEMLQAKEKRHAKELIRSQAEEESVQNLTSRNGQNLAEQLERLMIQEKVYCDPLLSIDKLAERLDTNRTYLSKVINEQLQTSYSNYINNLRLEEAISRLSNTDDETSMKDLAPSIGFNSHSSFYTLFKKRYGITPTLYRENVKRMTGKSE